MEFETKASLELEIDKVSTRVRDLQAAVRKNVDGVTLDHVREQITRLIELRKELQLWDEMQNDLEDNQATSPTTSEKRRRRKHKKKSTGNSMETTVEVVESESNQTEATNDDRARAQQRLVELELAIAKSDERIAVLEESLKREQLSKKALKYLNEQTEKRVVGRKISMPAELNKKSSTVNPDELYAEIESLKATLSIEREQLAKMHVVNSELQQSKEVALNALFEKVEVLTKENHVLKKSLKDGQNCEHLLRSEISRLENSIREAQEAALESKTNFGKLWKTVDDAKAANKNLEERNTQLEGEIRALRMTLEKAEKERMALETTRLADLEAKILSNDIVEKELNSKLAALDAANNALSTQLADSNAYNTLLKGKFAVIERELLEVQEREKAMALERDELSRTLTTQSGVYSTTKLEMEATILKLQKELTSIQNSAMEAESRLAAHEESTQNLITERNDAMTQIRELKDQIMSASIERDRAAELAAANSLQMKELQAAVDHATKQASTVNTKLSVLSAERASAEAELQQLRLNASTQDELLKKMRASLLEANVELKDVRASAQKWKTTAQNATSRLSEKNSEAENTRKQLGRTRSELTAISTSRQQLSESTKDKERKISKLLAEIQTLKENIAAIERAKSTLLKDKNDSISKVESLLKENAALMLKARTADTYRHVLLTIIPMIVAGIFYTLMK